MEIVRKQLSELSPSADNVRRHNQNQIKELVKAIESFDVIRPIVCDENGVILCGHGLYEALKATGAETADCIVKVGLTNKQKKKLMLADNKIYELGANDYAIIDSILKEFGQEGDFLIPGYSAETLEDLYGIRSVEESAQAVEYAVVDSDPVVPSEPTPPARVQERREQAIAEQQKHVILCPNCGAVIEL